MRLVGGRPVRAPSALLVKGWSGSGLIGPWPRPAGGSCQSATFVCQPKSCAARLGMAPAGSASAAAGNTAAKDPAQAMPISLNRSADDEAVDRDASVMLLFKLPCETQ